MSTGVDMDTRLGILEDHIKIMDNIGHKYAFIKGMILHGITKYKYALYGNSLN